MHYIHTQNIVTTSHQDHNEDKNPNKLENFVCSPTPLHKTHVLSTLPPNAHETEICRKPYIQFVKLKIPALTDRQMVTNTPSVKMVCPGKKKVSL
jgi:hypothetical protein